MTNEEFLKSTAEAARASGHVWPDYAACEAALESAWGMSLLATQDFNLFGMKQHKHHIYGDHILPTREFANGEWIVVNQAFVKYPGAKECFQDRMATLLRLAAVYPHYAAALHAVNGETFIREVSATWSSDPQRADKVLSIYEKYKTIFCRGVEQRQLATFIP